MRLNSSPELSQFDDVFISGKSRHADLVCRAPGEQNLERNPVCERVKSGPQKRRQKENAPQIELEGMQAVSVREKHPETPKHKTQ